MKREILDELTYNSFADFLEQGEKILWENSPEVPPYLSNTSGLMGLILLMTLFRSYYITLVFFFFTFSPYYYSVHKKRQRILQTKYALTSKRILIQQTHKGEVIIHNLLLEYIARVSTQLNHFNFKKGDIFLLMKTSQKGFFKTYSLENGHAYETPTLQQIEQVGEIAQLIRKTIKNVNTVL